MGEQKCFCAYLKQFVDFGLCYDLQMISGGYISSSALPDIKIDKAEIIKCCRNCEQKN